MYYVVLYMNVDNTHTRFNKSIYFDSRDLKVKLNTIMKYPKWILFDYMVTSPESPILFIHENGSAIYKEPIDKWEVLR